MKVAVIGANGQLGSDLTAVFSRSAEVTPLTHADVDVADFKRLGDVLEDVHADVVINTAGFHNVPDCEKDPVRSFHVNGLGALHLAKVCTDLDAVLVHYSTDYVFDGQKHSPYTEDDAPHPLNIYAITKLDGEYAVRAYCEKHFVIRISGLYGAVPCRAKGGNFITKIVAAAQKKDVIRVVDDEVLTPTPTLGIAQNTHALIRTDAYGLYHMSSEGACSWFEFTRAIFDALHIATPLEPCSVRDFPGSVKRPHYSVLENQRLKAVSCNHMRPWRDALAAFLEEDFRHV